jgi:IS30 family transposase
MAPTEIVGRITWTCRRIVGSCCDLPTLTQAEIDHVADELNDRPRETLHWRSPAEAFTQLETQYRHDHQGDALTP